MSAVLVAFCMVCLERMCVCVCVCVFVFKTQTTLSDHKHKKVKEIASSMGDDEILDYWEAVVMSLREGFVGERLVAMSFRECLFCTVVCCVFVLSAHAGKVEMQSSQPTCLKERTQ